MTHKPNTVLGVLLCCLAAGNTWAKDYKSTFSVETRAENTIQSEACAEATLKNMVVADAEFKDAKYLLITSDKKLTQTDSNVFTCEVQILWGIPNRTINSPLSPPTKPADLEEAQANTRSGSINIAIGHNIAFDTPKNYKTLSGYYLSGTYTTSNKTGYRLSVHTNRISYKFEENGKTKETKPYESIGIGIERPIISHQNLGVLARLDFVEPFPFSQTLKTGESDSIIQKITGSSYLTLGLPVNYQWNDVNVSAILSRVLLSEDKKLHPYSAGVELGYRW
jgi:hypothetical protein